jgi:predicted phosphodiesterase
MIMIVSDTHCYYEMVNVQINYAQNILGHDITSVIHLGDFGIYTWHLRDFFIKRKERFLKPLYCIDGNHEEFHNLHKLAEKYKEYFTYLPRGSLHNIGNYRFLALGGAAYMDSMITERGAVITNQQIDRSLSHPADSVDIIITHDCPTGIEVPNTPGMEHFGEPGFPRSHELAERYKPKIWFFGHHHKWHSHNADDVEYYGLSGVWKGFGLLDDNFNFTMIDHRIEWAESPLIEKILVRLKIIRPDSASFK